MRSWGTAVLDICRAVRKNWLSCNSDLLNCRRSGWASGKHSWCGAIWRCMCLCWDTYATRPFKYNIYNTCIIYNVQLCWTTFICFFILMDSGFKSFEDGADPNVMEGKPTSGDGCSPYTYDHICSSDLPIYCNYSSCSCCELVNDHCAWNTAWGLVPVEDETDSALRDAGTLGYKNKSRFLFNNTPSPF